MFTIEPFVGAIPLRFGMSPEEVSEVVGPPTRSYLGPFGAPCEERSTLSMDLSYDLTNCQLNELVFGLGSRLFFQGQDLFECADPINLLRRHDKQPKQAVGMIFFLNLGIRLSGFHDGDEPQKAVGITPAGHWNEFIDEFEEFC